MPSRFPKRSFPPTVTWSAVLELNGGEAGKIGLRRGDKVIYPGLAKK